MLNRLKRFLHLGVLITIPNNIVNGTLIDANPVMANFNAIASQVNAGVPALIPVTTSITSFTPALNFGGGTTGITYVVQSGAYVRVASMVFFTISIQLSSKGSSTGNMQVSGLPFACNASWPTGGENIYPVKSDFVTYSGNVYADLTAGSSSFAIVQQITAAGHPSILQETAITNAGELSFCGAYSL
jgi:hypothetical protein